MILKYAVDKLDSGTRLNNILKNKLYISSRLLLKLKNNKSIFVNNVHTFTNYIVKENDIIEVNLENTKNNEYNITPCHKVLDILYEDDYLLIVNKPSNTYIHPSINCLDESLANMVMGYYIRKNYNINTVHILTRLDKNTSGICIIAKNEYVQQLFLRKSKEIDLKKQYIAAAYGIIKEEHGIIEENISRKSDSIILREINKNGVYAKTEFNTIYRVTKSNYSIVKILLHTGRTHQIRLHMAHIGHVLLGDELYGKEYKVNDICNYINRQALHAVNISFNHPITMKHININSPIPEDIKRLYH